MKKYIVPFILLAAAALSCQSELTPEGGLPQEMIDLTVEAVVEDDADTKTSLGGTSASDFRDVLWDRGDEIAFFADGASSFSKFTNLNDQDAQKTAVFSGSVQASEDYAAFYPYDAVQSIGQGKVYFTLPATQIYQQDGFADGMSPMVGRLSDGKISFKNLCGILVLNLVGEGKVSTISFKGYDEYGSPKPLSGDASVNYTYSYAQSIDMDDAQGYSVVLDCGEGVQLSVVEETSFYIVLPPGEYYDFEITICLIDGKEMTQKGIKPISIGRSVITSASSLTFKGVTNLSREGTANCYIVTKSGDYKFKATKGNTNVYPGEIASVSVLWESYGTSTIPSVGDLLKDVSYSNGFIQFSTPSTFHEGNAVLAAKDVSGNILWSWHIWLTDYPEEQEYANDAGVMMDRNLGATEFMPGYAETLGLLYQWGRKDPFLGASSINGATRARSTVSWPSSKSSSSSVGTIEYTISHPMVFITDNSYNYDWYYTGSDATNTSRWGIYKTVYDPCPVGWRVCDGGKYNGIWYKASESLKGHTFDKYDKGMNFSGYFGADDIIWYPASGVISGSSNVIGSVGDVGYYWSANVSSRYAYYFFFNLYGSVDVDAIGRGSAEGCSVRCQKE